MITREVALPREELEGGEGKEELESDKDEGEEEGLDMQAPGGFQVEQLQSQPQFHQPLPHGDIGGSSSTTTCHSTLPSSNHFSTSK